MSQRKKSCSPKPLIPTDPRFRRRYTAAEKAAFLKKIAKFRDNPELNRSGDFILKNFRALRNGTL